MRIVFPLGALNLSGGVKTLLLQAGALADAGHEVTVLAPDFAAGSPFPVNPRISVRRLRTGSDKLSLRVRQLVYYARLALSCTSQADVCFVAFFLTAYCGAISSLVRRTRTTLLYSVVAYEPLTHGALAEGSRLGRTIRKILAWGSYRLPSRKMYISHWLRDAVGGGSGFILGHGINTDVFQPDGARTSGTGPLTIGIVARRGRVKGYADFLEAVEHLNSNRPVHLRILAMDDVALPTRWPVEVFPPTDEAGMCEFYRGCDIFVFPSISEGFPDPPLEAMACGAAVLATSCGGVAEYAHDECDCLIVPPANPQALRVALQRLCDDANLRARLSAQGVRTAQDFQQRQYLQRLVDWLSTIRDGD